MRRNLILGLMAVVFQMNLAEIALNQPTYKTKIQTLPKTKEKGKSIITPESCLVNLCDFAITMIFPLNKQFEWKNSQGFESQNPLRKP